MTRREFAKRASKWGGVVAGTYVVGRGVYSAVWEAYHLQVTRWDVPLPRLPLDLDGLKIGLLSDIHVCPSLPADYVVQTLSTLQALSPEAVLLTGDLVSDSPDHLVEELDTFARVTAPRGKYAVLGNHDFYYDRAGPVTEFLRQTEWEPSRNRSAPLPGTKGRIWIAGVDDPVTEREDLDRALAEVPDEAVSILLSHTPDIIKQATEAGVDLMVAGHTHGGQVVLPLIGPPVVPSKYGAKYAWGLFNHSGTRLAVTRGVGMITPRIRFRCRPEVVLLTLKRDDRELPTGGRGTDMRPQVRQMRNGVRTLRKLTR